jgi:hypothetical protein
MYQMAVVAASEIYWDGECIGRNGEVGRSAAEEQSGRSAQLFIVPRRLSTHGEHCIALRVSNFSTVSGCIETPLQLGYHTQLHRQLNREGGILLFLAGVFLIAGLFHSALLFGYGEKRPYAIFSALAISCAIYIFIQSLVRYFQIDLRWYYHFATLNDIPWASMMILLPLFYVFEFDFPQKVRVSMAIGGITMGVVIASRLATIKLLPLSVLVFSAQLTQIHVYLTILFSFIVALWAMRNGKAGSRAGIIGLAFFLAGIISSFYFNVLYGWAAGFAFLILFLIISLTNHMAHRRRLQHGAELRAARLQLQLLKKYIQPHFLLNSLNSIVAWLDEEPKTAAQLVTALAKELRLLLDFSEMPTIPIAEEIRLCRLHCEVMSLRHEKEYDFDIDGGGENFHIPPFILHTLVENGITHGFKGKETGRFLFRIENREGMWHISLYNDGVRVAAQQSYPEGTGIRYVKSRLEENFPGRWDMSYGPVEDGWKVDINLKKEQ